MNFDTISFLLGTIAGGVAVNLLSTDVQYWMAKGSFGIIRRFATPRLPSFLQDQYRDQWIQSCRDHGPLTQFCIAMNSIRKAGLIRKGYPADLMEANFVINGKSLRMDWRTAFASACVIWLCDKLNQQDQTIKQINIMADMKESRPGDRESFNRITEVIASVGPLKSIALIDDNGEGLEASLGPASTPQAISPSKAPSVSPKTPRT